ncbi:hypothetical protein COF68_05990 [Bacillus toyonensis]|uniref:hypothetical protein n=1 Tax=Bacillus toyonensis TaxID=155322 RepID=UPI000BFB3957|nr:hypothetical protein [Bacillus toyonensis]PHE64386.1 hypothetical protein COF68_05990 [Bacillus toyonensis]
MKRLSITDIIKDGKNGDKFRIISSSASNWVDTQITVFEPTPFNVEPFKSIIVTDLPMEESNKQYMKKPVPLLGAVLSAEFIKEDNED